MLLKEAVALEDGIPYNEPPVWHHPPRQVLGGVLLEAGRAKDAETVYRKDLERFRENGWSLFGLCGVSRRRAARRGGAAEHRFKKAWARADVALIVRSRVMSAETAIDHAAHRRHASTYVEQGDPPACPSCSCTATPTRGARSSRCCRTCRVTCASSP